MLMGSAGSSFLSCSYSRGQMVSGDQRHLHSVPLLGLIRPLPLSPHMISLGILRAFSELVDLLIINLLTLWPTLANMCILKDFMWKLQNLFWPSPRSHFLSFVCQSSHQTWQSTSWTPRVADVDSTSQWWNDLYLQRWPPKMTVVTSIPSYLWHLVCDKPYGRCWGKVLNKPGTCGD